MRAVNTRLQALADMVEEGRMDRADAAVISQIWNVYLRAISTELKVKEVAEFEERIGELERALVEGRIGALEAYINARVEERLGAELDKRVDAELDAVLDSLEKHLSLEEYIKVLGIVIDNLGRSD